MFMNITSCMSRGEGGDVFVDYVVKNVGLIWPENAANAVRVPVSCEGTNTPGCSSVLLDAVLIPCKEEHFYTHAMDVQALLVVHTATGSTGSPICTHKH